MFFNNGIARRIDPAHEFASDRRVHGAVTVAIDITKRDHRPEVDNIRK